MRYLIVAAHPDDEILGCGATMAKLSKAGHKVHIVILGEGGTARFANRAAGKRAVSELRQQALAAAKIVGAASVEFEGLQDNRFDELPLLEVVKAVEKHVGRISPAVIFTHHAGDLNIDHQVTARAVVTATRPVADGSVLDVYSFEVPSSTEWAFGVTGAAFQPNVFEDVGRTLELKVRALACYPGEMRPFPHPRSAEALEACARKWGSASGLRAAEAFQLIRSVRR